MSLYLSGITIKIEDRIKLEARNAEAYRESAAQATFFSGNAGDG